MVELLSPAGDFECLKAAVQNGADAVYFGSNLFSARAFATNFDTEELEQAINYAKLRGVKTHLTLNTLIKNEEFEEAFNVAKTAYELGIDAIIVQDLGLAITLIKAFPDLEIHASTQMTTTNLEGVKKLEQLGFKRAVLSRECSISEIKNICENSNIEIEVFIHGALCISYSGQCLFSSMVGGRSGNRGKCAQPCRLPYTLCSKNEEKAMSCDKDFAPSQILDKGYLLSTRDLCSLKNLPDLISAGVTSFKIEGRMKSPTYVATVTRIYRKYIDLATKFISNKVDKYEIYEKDMQDLMQVFNRGNFSSGHLLDEPNKKLIFPPKPNNMGITLGKILKYNKNKGLITVKLENNVSIGDGISFENETTKYIISELMQNNNNIKNASSGMIVTFGRIKGNIKIGDKIHKITDKALSSNALDSFRKEYKKTYLSCSLKLKAKKKVDVFVKSLDFSLEENFVYDYIPDAAKNAPITTEKIYDQFNKTLNTCFEFYDIDIDLDDNLFIPTSILNDIRRQAISKIENKIIENFKRTFDNKLYAINFGDTKFQQKRTDLYRKEPTPIVKSLLLNTLNIDFDYSKLKCFDRIYVPLKYFADKRFANILNILSNNSKLYIYMPLIVKDRYLSTIENIVDKAIKEHDISGAVVSEISSLHLFKDLDLIANYTLNVYNSHTALELKNLGFSTITLSPELDGAELSMLKSTSTEVICYGKIPLMTMSYCLLGKSNRCYKDCKHLCLSDTKFYLNDRYNFNFRVIPDNLQTLTTIYNSRNISIPNVNSNSIRFDILDETIDEINKLI